MMTDTERIAWREQMIADIAFAYWSNTDESSDKADYLELRVIDLREKYDAYPGLRDETWQEWVKVTQDYFQRLDDVQLFEEYRGICVADTDNTKKWIEIVAQHESSEEIKTPQGHTLQGKGGLFVDTSEDW